MLKNRHPAKISEKSGGHRRIYKACDIPLTMLFKIQQNLAAVPMPSVICAPVRSTPRHPHDCQHMYTSTNSYKYSFFIQTVHQWNLLPPTIAFMVSLSSFKAAMDSYSISLIIMLLTFNMHLAFLSFTHFPLLTPTPLCKILMGVQRKSLELELEPRVWFN